VGSKLLPEPQQGAEQDHREEDNYGPERAIVRIGKDDIREEGNHADRKQHTVKWRDERMEKLLVPSRRPFVGDFIRTILLPPRLDLLLRKPAPARLQARQRFFGRARAQLRQR